MYARIDWVPAPATKGPSMLNTERTGTGKPLVLVHGLGSSVRTWDPVLPLLQEQREVIAIDLPGFGGSAPLAGEVTIATLTDAVEQFLEQEDLRKAFTGVVLSANDPVAAYGGVDILRRKYGIEPIAITGPSTDNIPAEEGVGVVLEILTTKST